MASARDSILDAFEDLLVAEGERGATLDAVARRAGVSKGGLLYHFPSKERLIDGACARFDALVADDVAEMRTAEEGVVRFYIRTSASVGDPLDRALIAIARLQQAGSSRARDAMQTASDAWLGLLQAELGDAELARAVKLIGDGLCYNVQAQAIGGQADAQATDARTDALLETVDRLIAAYPR